MNETVKGGDRVQAASQELAELDGLLSLLSLSSLSETGFSLNPDRPGPTRAWLGFCSSSLEVKSLLRFQLQREEAVCDSCGRFAVP